ncbi:MAG: hypothetical protein COZ06_00055 [Armatimonadetes bacterium CG_4_10_14_3_um_filter_66_18]|nr:MAG: hypothetical protein COS65_19155 [Armatimonadetes bacterium CG06_land_8_20_14_3_00_66_21]PIX46445.1 MAG: hypothetical protein COZ57_12060 [Armatimonadetes bacterium CG_4_8_14_3_um_filter_66_20]PIY54444.1 MAG: hypothetical protein COZ06_00055 [Armatimonadetes bacterium CG_4_10_14_3_um_filter_66_18]PIZ34387.1 MAG: hypothetical protein COY42_28735 [Armatimonadetes bacterium CG_4_10_14_0_8_um_filter_66_14]PJB60084.1 MAG: hypothetical protein CO096_35735 [Armatimonadetes bacterium CG_4_9_14_
MARPPIWSLQGEVPPVPEKKTVLVCDDDESIRKSLRSSLEFWGHSVIEAGDGLEGLEVARLHRPDLVVLDMLMPGLSGDQVCRDLKGDDSTCGIPILLLSGVKDEAGLGMGLDPDYLPADRFLDKPPNMKELRAAVEALLDAAS